jgi:hypothetical protein
VSGHEGRESWLTFYTRSDRIRRNVTTEPVSPSDGPPGISPPHFSSALPSSPPELPAQRNSRSAGSTTRVAPPISTWSARRGPPARMPGSRQRVQASPRTRTGRRVSKRNSVRVRHDFGLPHPRANSRRIRERCCLRAGGPSSQLGVRTQGRGPSQPSSGQTERAA